MELIWRFVSPSSSSIGGKFWENSASSSLGDEEVDEVGDGGPKLEVGTST
jgi:hypothetical protein